MSFPKLPYLQGHNSDFKSGSLFFNWTKIAFEIQSRYSVTFVIALIYNLYQKYLSLKDCKLSKGTSVLRNTQTHRRIHGCKFRIGAVQPKANKSSYKCKECFNEVFQFGVLLLQLSEG